MRSVGWLSAHWVCDRRGGRSLANATSSPTAGQSDLGLGPPRTRSTDGPQVAARRTISLETSIRTSLVPGATETAAGTSAAARRLSAANEASQQDSSIDPEIRRTLDRIATGGPFPYRQDDTVFMNREGRLPKQSLGYYREFTVRHPVPTIGAHAGLSAVNGASYFSPKTITGPSSESTIALAASLQIVIANRRTDWILRAAKGADDGRCGTTHRTRRSALCILPKQRRLGG